MYNPQVKILFDRKGQISTGNFSYPARPIRYHRLETKELIMDLSISWRPIFLQLNRNWPNPLEWLKITLSGQPVYYSSLGYGDLASLFEQFYVPCLLNDLETGGFFSHPEKKAACRAASLMNNLGTTLINSGLKKSLAKKIIRHQSYWQKFYKYELTRLLQCRINVLPPDTMICDYDVYPIITATGCLYNCGFCKAKDGTEFLLRTPSQIKHQAESLAGLLGQETDTYKGLFIGNQDGLNSPIELIGYACEIGSKLIPQLKNCFIFGSIESLLAKPDSFFADLEATGLNTYINIGIESVDKSVLNFIKKPVGLHAVRQALEKISRINHTFPRIEISCNILANSEFPSSHWQSLTEYLKNDPDTAKGPIYLSPFQQSINRKFFQLAKSIKRQTHRPIRIYNLIPL